MSALAKTTHSVRPTSAAGLYYPRDAAGLRLALHTLLASGAPAVERLPKALVVPHAGYGYSGTVAAAGYRLLETPAAGAIRHVVLLGPSHRVAIRGLAMPSWAFYSTPFGEVPVNADARTRLRELGLAGIDDAPHALEHSFEVQLPFLQATLRDFDLLPIAAGTVQAEQVCRALEAVWGGPETLIVVSSDLSHHHTHVEAKTLDEQTAQRILARRSDLADAQACGASALNGLLECARQKELAVCQLGLQTSGDSGGDDSRVVGYGSFALFEP